MNSNEAAYWNAEYSDEELHAAADAGDKHLQENGRKAFVGMVSESLQEWLNQEQRRKNWHWL